MYYRCGLLPYWLKPACLLRLVQTHCTLALTHTGSRLLLLLVWSQSWWMGVVPVSGHPGSVMYGKPAASGRTQLAVGGECCAISLDAGFRWVSRGGGCQPWRRWFCPAGRPTVACFRRRRRPWRASPRGSASRGRPGGRQSWRQRSCWPCWGQRGRGPGPEGPRSSGCQSRSGRKCGRAR